MVPQQRPHAMQLGLFGKFIPRIERTKRFSKAFIHLRMRLGAGAQSQQAVTGLYAASVFLIHASA
jgi:hypothetical protein